MKHNRNAIIVLLMAQMVSVVGCSSVLFYANMAELSGDNVRPVAVNNQTPFSIYVEGGYNLKSDIDPGKTWFIETDKNNLIFNASVVFTNNWRSGSRILKMRFGQSIKYFHGKSPVLVLTTNDFPVPPTRLPDRRIGI